MAEVKKEARELKQELEEKSFALSLLEEFKVINKRQFLIILLLVAMLVGTNMAWLYVFQSYDYVSYETSSEGGGNANILHGNGDINNGESKAEDQN